MPSLSSCRPSTSRLKLVPSTVFGHGRRLLSMRWRLLLLLLLIPFPRFSTAHPDAPHLQLPTSDAAGGVPWSNEPSLPQGPSWTGRKMPCLITTSQRQAGRPLAPTHHLLSSSERARIRLPGWPPQSRVRASRLLCHHHPSSIIARSRPTTKVVCRLWISRPACIFHLACL